MIYQGIADNMKADKHLRIDNTTKIIGFRINTPKNQKELRINQSHKKETLI